MLHALHNGYELVGPLSNAPGVSAKKSQQVWQYLDGYETSDDLSKVNAVQAYLLSAYMGSVVESPVNGFFQMAKLSTWWDGRFSEHDVYRPVNKYTSKGFLNRTPLMTLNEDELQGRWRNKGWRSAACLSSFIFHYRAVTRGKSYAAKGGKWFRKEGGVSA